MSIREKSQGAPEVTDPWPSYKQFRNLSERERQMLYDSAKAYRGDLERVGIHMAETYELFVRRVAEELNI